MSIHQTDIKRFHTEGFVTLSPCFPHALLDAANEAIDALNDADFIPEGQGDSFGIVVQLGFVPFVVKETLCGGSSVSVREYGLCYRTNENTS